MPFLFEMTMYDLGLFFFFERLGISTDFLFWMARNNNGLFIWIDKEWLNPNYLEWSGMIKEFLFGMTRKWL